MTRGRLLAYGQFAKLGGCGMTAYGGGHSAKRQGRLSTMGSHRRPRGGRIFFQAPERGKNHAARMRPSCCKAVTPSSRPISSRIFPFLSFNTVVPVNFILRPGL